jgi:hypothetical protein
MGPRSKKQQMLASIRKMGGMEVVLDRIAAGETLTSVAYGLGVSRYVLGDALNTDARWRSALRVARRSAADALIEEALAIADRATNSTEAVARLRVYERLWQAARYCPHIYGREARRLRSSSGVANADLACRMDAWLRGPRFASSSV